MFSGNDDVCEVNDGQFVSKTQQNIEENMKKGDGSGDKCLHMNINVTACEATSFVKQMNDCISTHFLETGMYVTGEIWFQVKFDLT